MLHAATETCLGLFALFRLGLQTRFRLRGPYWRWRMDTAFGRGLPESRAELLRSVIEYARWMARMRSLR